MPLELRIVIAQSSITLAVAAIFLIAGFGASSVLLGGFVVTFGTGYAAYTNHRQKRRHQASQGEQDENVEKGVWRNMVAIEAQRMLLVAALCVSVFVLYPQLSAIAFFTGMLGAIAAYALAPLLER